MTTALITGITGQDGSYLAELLLDQDYQVHGIIRTTTADIATTRIGHLVSDESLPLTIHIADLADEGSLTRLIAEVEPDEIYNLAAQSHVRASFDQPVHTGDITGLGAIRVLEAIRTVDSSIRFYQASSSEMFGSTPPPQDESTPFHPRSPYGIAKVYAYWATVNYRESYAIHASNGILFNHESPRRGKEFVTRKITDGVARIRAGQTSELALGNLDARRDWGHAKDYVRAMQMLVQHDQPMDVVVGSGESHSVREFVEIAFELAGLDWTEHVSIDERFFRPAEVDYLEADPGLARTELGWEPEYTFRELVEEMLAADCERYNVDL